MENNNNEKRGNNLLQWDWEVSLEEKVKSKMIGTHYSAEQRAASELMKLQNNAHILRKPFIFFRYYNDVNKK